MTRIADGWALGRFAEADGRSFAGVVAEGRVRPLEEGVNDLFADWAAAAVRLDRLACTARGGWIDLRELRVLPPVEPRQILQSGANYRRHVVDLVAAEFLGDADRSHGSTLEEARAFATDMMDARARDGEPYIFQGLPSALCGAFDDVILPPHGTKHDYELELAVVIGEPARNVARAEAMCHVAGYTISNDITTRDLVYRPDLKAVGTDWLRAKNAPTFLPTGPFTVPAERVGDPGDLRITLRHNGVVRQDESTADMIFDVPRLVEYASRLCQLLPGDLLLTGSPAGNGAHWDVFLSHGDVVKSQITGLGTQRNTCVAG